MKCPQCSSLKNSVIDSRLTDNNTAIRRRRQCDECDGRFTTFERLRAANLIVIKKDQTREEYDREKLERGIWRACEKRPIKKEQISSMLNRLEEKWAQNSETPTSDIGEDVMEGLKEIDPVAYIRFASVYRAFSDVKSFEETIKKLH
ncbi:MAG: transcriptional regulator NrdR [Candidatus Altimarinota bacterium]